jgi:hypothetical protein
VWQGKDETLLTHANTGNWAGGMDTDNNVALAGRWAVEIGA